MTVQRDWEEQDKKEIFGLNFSVYLCKPCFNFGNEVFLYVEISGKKKENV